MKFYYSGCGEWIVPLTVYARNVIHVAGVFNLPLHNQRDLKYRNETIISHLLPCYDHEDGVRRLDGDKDKDDATFRIEHPRQRLITMKDVVAEETETKTKKKLSITAARTQLNIIAVLLEYINGETLDIEKHPSYSTEAKLIVAIVKDYVELRKKTNIGLSKRTLEEIFAKAKNSLKIESD